MAGLPSHFSRLGIDVHFPPLLTRPQPTEKAFFTKTDKHSDSGAIEFQPKRLSIEKICINWLHDPIRPRERSTRESTRKSSHIINYLAPFSAKLPINFPAEKLNEKPA